jgi:hypothetical protein
MQLAFLFWHAIAYFRQFRIALLILLHICFNHSSFNILNGMKATLECISRLTIRHANKRFPAIKRVHLISFVLVLAAPVSLDLWLGLLSGLMTGAIAK